MGVVENIITDNLPIWSSTVQSKSSAGRGTSSKRKLYGVKKLRELILDLAVRGLLVPQDPNDECASVLLKKIATEKKVLISRKTIKTEKIINDKEMTKPFILKKGWSWSNLGSLGNIFNGNSINSKVKEEKYSGENGISFIATKDIGYGFESINYSNGVKIPKDEAKFKLAKKKSVFICAEGGSAGKKCGITNQDVFFGNKLFANELYGGVNPAFILSCYLSDFFWKQFKESMTGIIGGISRNKFICLAIPVPPLAEQHRIVAKVDELMALCDTLEQQQEDSIQAHETLVEALLEALTSAVDADAFQAAWERISKHFDVLFTTEHSIDKLKETILQLAVMGKLVSQDPSDVIAAVLIQKLSLKRECTVHTYKMKKKTTSSFSPAKDHLFGLPDSWEWARIESLMDANRQISYGIIKLGVEPAHGGISTLRCSDVKAKTIDLKHVRKVAKEIEKPYERTRLMGGEVLVNIRGTLGGVALVPIELAGYNIAREVAMLPIDAELNGSYLVNAIASPYFWNLINANLKGIAYKGLNLSALREIVVPLPPTAEQYRIVAKVDELMALCDQLKESLQQIQQTQIHLTDAVVENAL